ncbi:hypothetical protein [Aestuariicoccus sp. MJ-SS9]|nr:hypothetical protein [Aestuariicoccus sp. MJ-SS9]MDU8913460.1 hypothetical protein [Aestuariicoccus sp. MJ-SS9]
MLLPVGTPALAHAETAPHLHNEHTALLLGALAVAAAVALAFFRKGV